MSAFLLFFPDPACTDLHGSPNANRPLLFCIGCFIYPLCGLVLPLVAGCPFPSLSDNGNNRMTRPQCFFVLPSYHPRWTCRWARTFYDSLRGRSNVTFFVAHMFFSSAPISIPLPRCLSRSLDHNQCSPRHLASPSLTAPPPLKRSLLVAPRFRSRVSPLGLTRPPLPLFFFRRRGPGFHFSPFFTPDPLASHAPVPPLPLLSWMVPLSSFPWPV